MSNVGSSAAAPRAAAVAFGRVAVVVTAAYMGAQMVADISSLKIGVVFGLQWTWARSSIPSPFTLRDVVHKVLGKRNVQTPDRHRGGGQSVYGRLSGLGGAGSQRPNLGAGRGV
jgi:hypothetical protein